VLILWQGIWTPTKHFNSEKQAANAQHRAYLDEYESGWSDQCGALFSRIANTGVVIFGKNTQMTFIDCQSLIPMDGAERAFKRHIGGYVRDISALDMGKKGRNKGDSDALDKIFALSPYWCWGQECVTIRSFDITK
jgi:hypothetical protein